MQTKQFKKWKTDKEYLKRQKEKRQLVFKIICIVVFIIGVTTGSKVFTTTIEPVFNSYKEDQSYPDTFTSYEEYERSFRESNKHLFK